MAEQEKEIVINIESIKKWIFLALLFAIFVFEIQLTLNSPIAFGDEGFHVTVARWIGTNIAYPVYTPLHDTLVVKEHFNRLPFWNFVEASFYMLFGFNEVIIKILMPFISFLTGLAVYVFTKKIFNENTAILASIITVTIPSFVTYSVLFYAIIPFVFFFSIALLSFLAAVKTERRRYYLTAALFTSIAILTDIAGLFLPVLFLLVALYEFSRQFNVRGLLNVVKKYAPLFLIPALFVAPFAARNIALYYLPGCTNISDIVQGNCPKPSTYISQISISQRTAAVSTEVGILQLGLLNYLRFAYGFVSGDATLSLIGLAFIPFSFLAGLALSLTNRNKVNVVLLLTVLIFVALFSHFGGLFNGRAEDTARYFLDVVPIIGIMSATYFSSLTELFKKYKRFVTLFILLNVIVLALVNFQEKLTTMAAVKQFSPLFFQACDWIKQNTPQNALLFSLQTYPTMYNCQRDAIWEIPDKADILLSNNITTVNQRLQANGINYIFVQKFSLSAQAYAQAYPVSFVEFLNQNNSTFQKIYENGPDLNTCLNQGGCDGTLVYKVL